MSVLWFEETGQEEERVEGTRRDYTRYFRAECSSYHDGSKTLLLTRPELAPYQPHPRDPLAFVKSFEPTRVDGSLLWDVTVPYSTDRDERVEKNPLARPAKITIGSAERTILRLVDAEGKPILNTAGDLIDDPPVEDEIADLVFNVEKNVPIRLPTWLLKYRNAINTDWVRVRGINCPPESLRLKGLSIGDEDAEDNTPFCVLSFQLHHREEGWTHLIPNRGFYEKVPQDIKIGASGIGVVTKWKRKEILVGDPPDKPSEPQMLDQEGRRITLPTVDNIVILKKKVGRYLPFSVLPLK